MQINDIPDYMSAVYDLIAYVTNINGNKIFRGNQSREVMPRDNDYIVYTPITQKRIGTTSLRFTQKILNPPTMRQSKIASYCR